MNKEYLSQQSQMPDECSKELEAEVRACILEKLNEADLMYFSSVAENGWPDTVCMHFVTIEEAGQRPVFYLFTHDNVKKMDNIKKNNKTSVSICHTESFEKRNETWSFQFMCVAQIVEDENEKAMAVRETRKKKGYEFAQMLPLENQPCIKVEPIYGAWTYGQGHPAFCSIDYLKAKAEPA